MSRRRKRLTLWGICVWIVVGGCTSLPDVSPFVAASSQLQSAIGRTGSLTLAELQAAGLPQGEDIAKLTEAWKTRNAAVKALVDYSSALQEITDAGNKGGEAAANLANKVTELAGAVGLSAPAGVIGVATDAVSFVFSQIAKARAAKSLEQALEAASPAVSAIAEILANDVRDMDEILAAASQLVVNHINDRYESERLFREALEKRRKDTYDATFDVADPADADLAAAKESLRAINELLEGTGSWYFGYQAELKEARRRGKEGLQLLDATAIAIDQWAAAHASVAKAIADRRPVSVAGLVQASAEIHALIQRIRGL